MISKERLLIFFTVFASGSVLSFITVALISYVANIKFALEAFIGYLIGVLVVSAVKAFKK